MGGADGAPGVGSVIRRTAEPLVVAGLAAHGSVVALTAFSAARPLLTALVGTLVFAGISLAYGRRPGALVRPSPGRLAETVVADAWAAYPLAVVALLWIAQFYGFFSLDSASGPSAISSRLDAGSVLTSKMHLALSASRIAVAHASAVLPTPPFPVKKR